MIMSKETILMEFEIDVSDPSSQKDGNSLYYLILKRTKRLIIGDRLGVLNALRYWFSLRSDPFTLIAVNLVQDLQITELKPELKKLRKEIESGKAFLPYYNEWVERALKAITK
jgi:hypothetical protein